MKYHFVYRITNIVLNMYYYGTHTSKNLMPKEDLGIKYFSSSKNKDFVKDQKVNPQNYKYKVIKIFETRKEALELEIKLHKKFNVRMHEQFYNRSNQKSVMFDYDSTGFKHSEKSKKQMSESSKGYKPTLETIQKCIAANTGVKKGAMSQEVKDKISLAHIGKTYSDEVNAKKGLAGEKNSMYGKKHSEETKELMSKSHKGFKHTEKSKELMSEHRTGTLNFMYGKEHSKETRKKMSESCKGIKQKTIKCPHCNKEGGTSNIKRYHFDNCKEYIRKTTQSLEDW